MNAMSVNVVNKINCNAWVNYSVKWNVWMLTVMHEC